MKIEYTVKQETGILTLEGDLNAVHVDRFRNEFIKWFDANPEVKNIIIDFTQVKMVDSAGLGSLIALLKLVDAREGELKLVAMSRRVRMVFEITRTHRIFDIMDTVESGMASIK